MTRLTDDSRLADRQVTEWMLRQRALEAQQTSQQQQAEAQKTWTPGAESPPPVITITRQIGGGGDSVARTAAELLGKEWQVWDNEIIEAVANDAHVRTEIVAALDEHVSGAIENFVRDLFDLRKMEPLGYQHHLVRVLLSVAQQGRKIFVGRAANFLLANALHVRVQTGAEIRIHTLMHEQNVSRAEATRLIHHTDQERAAFVRNLAHHRIDEEGAFDLVVWTDRLGTRVTAETIVAAAHAFFPGRC